jgi:HD-GYP domain-containing protein (c-di-GMP phosphodiesterase class II)
VNNQIKKLQELIKLDQDLQSIQDLDILLERILYNTRKFVNADAGTIYIRDGNVLVFSYAQNDTKERELKAGQKLIYSVLTAEINERSICGYVAKTKKILNLPDVYKIAKKAPYSFNSKYDKVSEYKTTSMLTIPLMTNTGDVLGVIQVINALDEKGNVVPFNIEDELFVLHFASTASMALQRAQLTRQIILRMISMAELRDPKETGPHVNRVASFAVELYERWASRRNIPVKEIEKNKDMLRMAAMLHDVGKVGISDIILKKPGRFTDDEYEIMKTHTFHGATLFKSMQSEFDDLASMVALTHHENWDGTGYPGHVDIETGKPIKADKNGKAIPLKGEEIPIFGRVVAIADVFDALSCKRVYKEAWEEADVLVEMKKLSGTKFDPELIEIFFESLEHFRNIMHRYPE